MSPTSREPRLTPGGHRRPLRCFIASCILATVPALALAAQQTRGRLSVEPSIGVVRAGVAAAAGENRWGGTGAVRVRRSVGGRFLLAATAAYVRVPRYFRLIGDRGGFVYDAEDIVTMAGISYEVPVARSTRLVVGAEAGPAWSRFVERSTFGTPRPALAMQDGGFSLGGGGLVSAGISHSVGSRTALSIGAQTYVGIGGGLMPALTFGLRL